MNVVEQDYISNVSIGYFEMLDSHVIMVGVSRDVHIDTVNDINAHYEGDNQFSLNTSEKISGSNVKIQIYDKYGKLLETKMNKLVVY
ncbi:hypothetical protein C7437_1011443 [Psychrobacillus insolitus]|uniref:Uncharacterized protein n=1 Tax=Psychrobacillus insolitus TaxID=1461 RepID=A0A2W7NCZ4_9BACI|nr:hypothetical protein [Psychrobacillus insolitus]PZX08319.1 hypothetical protein C7437_1011443 [Psychrobacillus insolitus]